MQLENVLGELLKHRRAMIRELGHESPTVVEAVKVEIQNTDVILKELQVLLDEIRKKYLG